MKKYLPVLAIVLAGIAGGGGCADLFSSGSQADLKLQLSEAEVCGGIGVGLSNVAPFRKAGTLASTDAAVITGTFPVTDPVCNAATPPSATNLATLSLTAAAGQISTVVAKYVK